MKKNTDCRESPAPLHRKRLAGLSTFAQIQVDVLLDFIVVGPCGALA